MIDSLTRDNHHDFNRRYANTFGWLLDDMNNKKLVNITNTDDQYVYFKMDGDMEYHTRSGSGVQFEFIPVNRGWFNTYDNSGVYYLQRVPQRQWKRGITSSNTQVLKYYDNVKGLLVGKLDYSLLEKIFHIGFNPHMPDDPYRQPVALSKDFALIDDNIYFNNQVIGKVASRSTLCLTSSLVQQELSDLIRRRGYIYTVEVDHDAA